MRRMSTAAVAAAALSVALVAAPRQSRPDYSGEWVLNLARSALDKRVAGGIERGTVRITHRDPAFTFDRVFTRAGKDEKGGYSLNIDGSEKVTVEGAMTTRSKIAWEDGVLVLRERIEAPQGQATNTVHYRLLDEGRTLEARESFRGPRFQYDNVWVLERRSGR